METCSFSACTPQLHAEDCGGPWSAPFKLESTGARLLSLSTSIILRPEVSPRSRRGFQAMGPNKGGPMGSLRELETTTELCCVAVTQESTGTTLVRRSCWSLFGLIRSTNYDCEDHSASGRKKTGQARAPCSGASRESFEGERMLSTYPAFELLDGHVRLLVPPIWSLRASGLNPFSLYPCSRHQKTSAQANLTN